MLSKQVILSVLAISAVALSLHGQGQFVFNTGETYTYEFTNVPFSQTVGVSGGTPGCGLTINYHSGDFQFEVFENSLTEQPFFGPFTSVGGPAFWVGFADHWQDFQGIIRFTALTDFVVINSFKVDVYVPRGSVSDTYSMTVVPVPEPSSTLLISVGGAGLLYCFWKKRSRRSLSDASNFRRGRRRFLPLRCGQALREKIRLGRDRATTACCLDNCTAIQVDGNPMVGVKPYPLELLEFLRKDSDEFNARTSRNV